MTRLKKRAEFLTAARGRKIPRRGFLLQFFEHRDPHTAPSCARFGFTVTKKVGNSVERNRIRRRLREAVRLHGEALARPGCDHVLVGRRDALTMTFSEIVADLEASLAACRVPSRRERGA